MGYLTNNGEVDMWSRKMSQSQGGSNNPAQNPGGGRTPATQPDKPTGDSKPSENQPSHQGNRPDSAQRPSQPDREGGR